eukprot:XP_001702543.1 predicted protein [Chlamydomonas reinhardtii]
MTEGQVGLVLDVSHVQFMRMAKSTVQDAGPAPASRGGKKLVAARPSLPPDTAGTVTTGAAGSGDVPLFVAVPASLLCRLAHTPPLRTLRQVQLGSLAAPTGSVTIAFMKVVGASTLLTELPGPASRALDQFQRLACGLLMGAEETTEHGAALDFRGRSGGYLVEGGDGLVLAAFGSPLAAVEWALDTVEALRELVWEEELLAHEMCEEVGLDVGPVTYSLTESSGRLSYRGRVMNRAARIAGTASPGQVLCSGAVWAACEAGMTAVPLPGSSQLVGVSLGKVALKGITSPVEIFQCQREGC